MSHHLDPHPDAVRSVTFSPSAPHTTSLSLGLIIPTSALPISTSISLQNHSSTSLSVSISLSPNLRPYLSLATYYTPPPPQPTPAVAANLNLLYRSAIPSLPLSLPPHSTTTHLLHFLPSPSLTTSTTAPCPISGRLLLHTPSRRSPLASVQLTANLALPYLLVSPPALSFAHIPALVHTTQPLNVRNHSPAPTSFLLSSSSPLLTFLHARKRTPLPRAAIRIPPFASRRVLVALRPHIPGAFTASLALDDVHNPAATIHIPVTAAATASTAFASYPALFDLDCGPDLDFGDCYSSCTVYRDVALVSKSPDRITVFFASDRRQQLTFELLPEWQLELDPSADLRRNHDPTSIPCFDEPPRTDSDRPMSPSNRAFSGALQMPASVDDHASDRLVRQTSATSSSVQMQSTASSENADLGPSQVPPPTPKTRPVEQVTLEPAQKRTVRVWYLPLATPRDSEASEEPASDLDRGRLCPDSFQLFVKVPTTEESRIVVGKARVCESILRLERMEMHLGDCNALSKYHAAMSIINCSDLPASATIDYVSQCVVADAHEVFIQPREAFDVDLSFVPRQVNPNYHKEITVTNKRNSMQRNMVFTLRANCIDRQGISLHALFYKILAPNPTNEIDFGVTVANHQAIRAFKVRNITQGRLTLRFTGGRGLTTYIPTQLDSGRIKGAENLQRIEDVRAFPDTNATSLSCLSDIDKVVSNLEAVRTVNALVDEQVRPRDSNPFRPVYIQRRLQDKERDMCTLGWSERDEVNEWKDTASNKEQPDFDENGESFTLGGERSWREFLKCLDGRDFTLLDSMPMFFSNYASEISYTEKQFQPARRLRAALRDGYLKETDSLTLSAGAEQLVVVSMNLGDSDVKGKTKTRPVEKQLTIQMLEFDNARLSDAAPTNSKEVNRMAKLFEDGGGSMPRALLLSVRACKSRMKIAPLRQLNFGQIACGVQKDKAFSIVNLSEAPLLYEIRKERSEVGDDLRFNLGKGTRGVVRPYFSKTVPFIYAPTTKGRFEQKIVVKNRLDHSASCELVVKAMVGKSGMP